jgi:TonB family protein
MARRRTHGSGLLWALLVSLLVNHGLLLPAAYLLFTYQDPLPDPVVEVALVPQEEQELQVDPPRPLSPKRRVTRLVRARNKPPPPEPKRKPEPKKKPEEIKQTRKPEPKIPPTLVPPRLKMVEVQNPESERAPENARFLSDKNRRVERETRARHTNLVKDHPRPEPRSVPNPSKDPDPGSRKKKVAEQREQPGKAKKQRERKERKEHRQRKKKSEAQRLLVMRSPQSPRREQKRLADRAPDGDLPPAEKARALRRAQKQKRLRLSLDHRSHDRIYGSQAQRERKLARLSPSKPRGRHDRKWKRIRAALENFIPEVQPGNQTALGTRANPFALYIARMHRNIHKLWGYGFLVDLDNKPDRHPMNNMRLWAMIEAVVTPEGKVAKATIVKNSGILPYDVAALDTIFSASPYPPTPRAIRSADGNVYLHWRFHRDQRQCGTFGVDPYILTKPPKGPIDGDMAEVGKGAAPPRQVRRLNRPRRAPGPGSITAPGRTRASGPKRAKETTQTPRAASRASNRDEAQATARRFGWAFQRGDTAAMAALCRLPFLAHGRRVASKRAELRRMLGDLVREGSKGRVARIGSALSAMEARRKLGRLPAGADYGTGVMLVPVDLGGTRAVLLLQPGRAGWQITGLNR